MGYFLKSVKNLPALFDWYMFLVGDYRNNSMVNNLFRDDFSVIADRIGDKAAIIQQSTNSNIEYELQEALKHNSSVAVLLSDAENKSPGLLLLNSHPKDLNSKTSVIYIPFKLMEKAYDNPNELIEDLICFSKGTNCNLLKKTTKKGFIRKVLEKSSLSIGIGVISINYDL